MGGYVALADMLISRGARTRPLIATIGRHNISCPLLYAAVASLQEKSVELIVDKGMDAVGGIASVPAALLAAAQFGLANVVVILLLQAGANEGALDEGGKLAVDSIGSLKGTRFFAKLVLERYTLRSGETGRRRSAPEASVIGFLSKAVQSRPSLMWLSLAI
ncbi:hypothetical protein Esi_0131_0044 [Ectocarpus siliculosus]|uniref:Uncharacterized protein n=1 Tax=Ectocarpus siliculosus TaxID=2880 RepID=D8LEI2_ECTSI|nr:hypothetical protein Esi_0131_0044 [Ectocarpus siliculosus]|eukprot:CBN80225.1 hypothetical protein Esi_0131_0044 [Ectocarpus siliculosus]